MFGVSLPELAVVFIVALLIFGPDKLPELARTVGRISAQFRRQSDSLRREFYNTVYKPADDFKSSLEREARSLVAEPITRRAEESTSSCPEDLRNKAMEESATPKEATPPDTESKS